MLVVVGMVVGGVMDDVDVIFVVDFVVVVLDFDVVGVG